MQWKVRQITLDAGVETTYTTLEAFLFINCVPFRVGICRVGEKFTCDASLVIYNV